LSSVFPFQNKETKNDKNKKQLRKVPGLTSYWLQPWKEMRYLFVYLFNSGKKKKSHEDEE